MDSVLASKPKVDEEGFTRIVRKKWRPKHNQAHLNGRHSGVQASDKSSATPSSSKTAVVDDQNELVSVKSIFEDLAEQVHVVVDDSVTDREYCCFP